MNVEASPFSSGSSGMMLTSGSSWSGFGFLVCDFVLGFSEDSLGGLCRVGLSASEVSVPYTTSNGL